MQLPKVINNISERVVDDLKQKLSDGSRVSIAAATFSIYAFEALKEELEGVEELRFIFTSPTFIKDKVKKEKREFFIPKLNRERSLYSMVNVIFIFAYPGAYDGCHLRKYGRRDFRLWHEP